MNIMELTRIESSLRAPSKINTFLSLAMASLIIFLLPIVSLAQANQASAQSSPLPGDTWTAASQVQSVPHSQMISGRASMPSQVSGFLPIDAVEAKKRIEELKTLVLIAPPESIREKIYALAEWLADLSDAHSKLAMVFTKQENMDALARAEKNDAQKFAHLKSEAQLLKAELLIKENRNAEALGPLVNIVIAEPKGSAGKAAYHKLKELGFSEEVPESVNTSSEDANRDNSDTSINKISSDKTKLEVPKLVVKASFRASSGFSTTAGRVHKTVQKHSHIGTHVALGHQKVSQRP